MESKWWARVLVDFLGVVLGAIVVALTICGVLFWKDVYGKEPAMVKVIGTPSALRPTPETYMRWHRCFECE